MSSLDTIETKGEMEYGPLLRKDQDARYGGSFASINEMQKLAILPLVRQNTEERKHADDPEDEFRIPLMPTSTCGGDVIFHVGIEEFRESIRAHRIMLVFCSPFFEALFTGHMHESLHVSQQYDHNNPLEIDIPDLHPLGFVPLIRYCYHLDPKVNLENVFYTMEAANKYQITPLLQACEKWVIEDVDAEGFCYLLENAFHFVTPNAMSACVEWLHKRPDQHNEFVEKDYLYTLPRVCLGVIVSSQYLALDEVDIFAVCVRWAHENHPDMSARDALMEVVHQIRFPTMKAEEFVKAVLSSDIVTKKEGLSILKKMYDPGTPCQFISAKREPVLPKLVNRVNTLSDSTWHYGEVNKDCIQMKADRKCFLVGVGINLARNGANTRASVECYRVRTREKIGFGEDDFTGMEENAEKEPTLLRFNEKILLEKDEWFQIELCQKGNPSRQCTSLKSEVLLEKITFRFQNKREIFGGGSDNGTSTGSGQLGWVYVYF